MSDDTIEKLATDYYLLLRQADKFKNGDGIHVLEQALATARKQAFEKAAAIVQGKKGEHAYENHIYELAAEAIEQEAQRDATRG